MKSEIRKGNKLISGELYNKIQERIDKNEQVMLLLNRRGYSNYVSCVSCGYISKCPNCDKCKQFYPMQEYTTNHYYGNQLFNKIIEMICKTTKNPVKIDSAENGAYTYQIGNIKIELTLPKRKSKKNSNLKCDVYYQYPNTEHKKYLGKFNKYSAKNGRELYDLYFDLIGMLATEKEYFNNLCVNNIK
jgi:hypothetical protein